VIVLSTARSCTSVVSTMLGQHPELYGFPELLLLAHRTVAEVLEGDSRATDRWREHHQAGLRRAVAELLIGDQSVTALAEASQWLEQHRGWEAVDLFDLLQEMVRPRVAVEKTPEMASTDIAIFRALIAYPRARFIHLVRHPLSTLQSMREHWQGREWMSKQWPLEATCAWIWYTSHRRVSEVLPEFAAKRSLRVKAEDVLNTPNTELPRIAGWLGVAANDEAVEAMLHPERSPYARVGPVGARGGHDQKFLTDPQVRPVEVPQSTELPSDWAIDPYLRASIRELAAEFGY
jgi:hypothetical protein